MINLQLAQADQAKKMLINLQGVILQVESSYQKVPADCYVGWYLIARAFDVEYQFYLEGSNIIGLEYIKGADGTYIFDAGNKVSVIDSLPKWTLNALEDTIYASLNHV